MLSIIENNRLRSNRKRRKKVRNILYFLIANALLLCNFVILYVSSSKDLGYIHELPLPEKVVTVQYLPDESLSNELEFESNEVITDDLEIED